MGRLLPYYEQLGSAENGLSVNIDCASRSWAFLDFRFRAFGVNDLQMQHWSDNA
jgi:hypothetical protein